MADLDRYRQPQDIVYQEEMRGLFARLAHHEDAEVRKTASAVERLVVTHNTMVNRIYRLDNAPPEDRYHQQMLREQLDTFVTFARHEEGWGQWLDFLERVPGAGRTGNKELDAGLEYIYNILFIMQSHMPLTSERNMDRQQDVYAAWTHDLVQGLIAVWRAIQKAEFGQTYPPYHQRRNR